MLSFWNIGGQRRAVHADAVGVGDQPAHRGDPGLRSCCRQKVISTRVPPAMMNQLIDLLALGDVAAL